MYFPSQCAYTQAEVLHTINDHPGRDSGQSDEILAQDPGGPFFEDKDDVYSDVIGHAFVGACVRFELIGKPPNLVD